MSKPLELTVYPLRWTGGRCTAPGRISAEPIDVDYWVACKRLTDAELAAENHAAVLRVFRAKTHGEPNSVLIAQMSAIYRFATLPHYDEVTS